MNNTANFYNTYVTAIALKSIAWKYYLVFVALNLTYGTFYVTHPKHPKHPTPPFDTTNFLLLLIDFFRNHMVFHRRRNQRSHIGRIKRSF